MNTEQKHTIETLANAIFALRIVNATLDRYDLPEDKKDEVAQLAKAYAASSDYCGNWEHTEEFLEQYENVEWTAEDIAHMLIGDTIHFNGCTGDGEPIYYFEEDPNSEASAEGAYSIAVALGIEE